jgi:ubiquinone/menaquinone biosynthesis C-methylase UbiE
LATPYSADFIERLAAFRPGMELVDELLRSEHPPYIQDRLAVLLAPFPQRQAWRALDFGCGAGASAVVLARLGVGSIVGVDLVNDYAALWRRRLAEAGFPAVGTFVQSGEGFSLPFRDGSFDAVFLNGVLEHLLPEERRSLLHEMFRLLPVGGHLFISETPNRWFPRNSHTKLWFSELLPARLAAAWAARSGVRRDFPRAGRTAQFRTGYRGMSVAQVQGILGAKARLVPADEGVTRFEYVLPRNPLEQSDRRNRLGAILYGLSRGIAALTFRPASHFAPHLNLVFRRMP